MEKSLISYKHEKIAHFYPLFNIYNFYTRDWQDSKIWLIQKIEALTLLMMVVGKWTGTLSLELCELPILILYLKVHIFLLVGVYLTYTSEHICKYTVDDILIEALFFPSKKR